MKIESTLPRDPQTFQRGTAAADVVSLHLLMSIQIVLDLSIFACIHFGQTAPGSYADAMARLAYAGVIKDALAVRLEKAAAFRDGLIHAFDDVDAASIHRAAQVLPGDLRMFMTQLCSHLAES